MIAPISRLVTECTTPFSILKSASESPVTILFVPDTVVKKRYLLGGCLDGTITLWDTHSETALVGIHGSSQRITHFFQCPENSEGKFRSFVLALGADQTVCLLNIEKYEMIHSFSGHNSSIISIHWLIADDIVSFQCEDGSLYAWELKTGHLDRIASGFEARDIIQSCDVIQR